MAKFVRTIRNNWKKKSTFGAVAVIYGINYGHEKYKVQQLMRKYCEEAVQYGDIPVPPTLKPRHVTVILNPAANRKKAKANFEKYCAPLLHLAGYTVNVVLTESEGQARTLAADVKDSDMIVVAGGDGTLSETVTGLMRAHGRVKCPVGVLPLGRTNSVACALLGLGREGTVSPGEMAAAAMAVVRGQTKTIDSIKVDVVQEEGTPPKPVYGLSGIRWGVYRDALSKQDRYWYLGPLRGYASVLFNSLHKEPIAAHVVFTHAFFTKKPPEVPQVNYQYVVNTKCGEVSELDLTGVDINISCPAVSRDSRGVRVSSVVFGSQDNVEEGWRRVRGELPTAQEQLEAQQLEIVPVTQLQENEEKWFSIDNEEYEVRHIRVTLIPKSVQVFLPQQPQTYYTLLERALLGCC
ncbi:acylglycerol kinase, mitochondrial-like [Homalodisca vitripennis]|uniref:acylglycerol kinase, mitochondrial-like n=1 Tax=Homalodisca vitripennis TaxID=197043 RepID=UPI001EEBB489|nr:acylglycerol kinase, mitochondrial-like [Homalodisca vitripennis]